jgi:hypothetical protein
MAEKFGKNRWKKFARQTGSWAVKYTCRHCKISMPAGVYFLSRFFPATRKMDSLACGPTLSQKQDHGSTVREIPMRLESNGKLALPIPRENSQEPCLHTKAVEGV